ncbi:MAG: hypothetical protein H0X59_00135 [Chloroflexi bacterium]|nr:hypothetical protein [Chloroflexota bacterium]
MTDRLEAERRRQAADLAAAEERAHLARELHDSVTQALFSNDSHHPHGGALAAPRPGRGPPTGHVAVSEDGVGFDESTVPSGHLGVAGIRARLGLIGGDLRISSEDGQGTTIQVRATYRRPSPGLDVKAAQTAPLSS